ncbi:MAG: gamma-glutamyltransferase [Gemmatimonadota bacterium]
MPTLRRFWLVPCALLLAIVPTTLPAQQPTVLPSSWKFAGKARVAEGRHAMVASGSPIASAVGRDIMKRGGNAVDAAVAVGFALTVVHSQAGNIGGGGFMMIRTRDGRSFALDYRETAPAKATRDMYLDAKGEPSDKSVYGSLAAGVPGSVAGMLEAHRRFGKLPLAKVIAPAIRLAAEGYLVDDYRSRSFRGAIDQLKKYESSARVFLVDGKEPQAGTIFKQPDLARTLRAIRDHGRDGFYKGWVADSIVAQMQRDGGIISAADLSGYQAKWRTPIKIDYRGFTIWSMPPSSSGGVTLAMILNVMEGFGPLPPFGSTALLHREAEAMRRAFSDRNRFLGDPDFEHLDLPWLLSKAHADSLRNSIDLAHATPTPPFDPSIRDGSSTTHYSVVDAQGNAVSTTTTLNNSYGAHVVVSGAGFLLNDEMDDFATAPGKPNMYGLVQGEINAIKPGKRMLSAMTPSIVVNPRGTLEMVVGTPGGPTIITQVYHVISNYIDHHMSLADAISAPRLHHQALPDRIQLEAGGFSDAVMDSLRAMGHQIRLGGGGDVEGIVRVGRLWQGVSDPRLGGGPSGY